MKRFRLSDAHQVKYEAWKDTNVPRIALGLGVLFVVAGIPKLLGMSFVVAEFERWQYPVWFVHFTGMVEIAAGAMLFVQRTRYFGALLSLAIMIAALITHLKFDYYFGQLIIPVGVLCLVSYVFRHFRHELRQKHVDIYLTEPKVKVTSTR